GAHLLGLEHRAEHGGHRHRRHSYLLPLAWARPRQVRLHDSRVMGVADGFPDTHFGQVVLKLLAAVQTNDIALALRLPRLGDRGPGRVRRRWGQRNSRFSTVSIKATSDTAR